MHSITVKDFKESPPLCQGENLLSYYHRLHQARQVADIPGRGAIGREAKRVKEKILFEESLV